MTLNFDVKAEPKECTACHNMSSYPQYESAHPRNTKAQIQVIRVEKGKMVEELGGTWATLYCCKKCGHIDFFTFVVRDINP